MNWFLSDLRKAFLLWPYGILNVHIIVPQDRKACSLPGTLKGKCFLTFCPLCPFLPSILFVCVFFFCFFFFGDEEDSPEKVGRRLPHCWCCHTLELRRDLKWLGMLKAQSSPTLSHLGFQLHFQIIGRFLDKNPDWLAFTQGPTQPLLWHLLIEPHIT